MKSQSLLEAIVNQSLEEAEYWAQKVPESINAYGTAGFSPLEKATVAGIEFVELLIKHQVNLHQVDEKGATTSLHQAVMHGKIETVPLLLKHGVDLGLRDRWGRTALHMAVHRGSREAVLILLKQGADPAVRTENDADAIHQAIFSDRPEILKILLNHPSSNIATRNKKDQGYLDYCMIYREGRGQTAEMASLLMDRGISPDQFESALAYAQQEKKINTSGIKTIEERRLVLSERAALAKVIEEQVVINSESLGKSEDRALGDTNRKRTL